MVGLLIKYTLEKEKKQMSDRKAYCEYSGYLKTKYGEKVYKLPVNIPVTCPNRKNGEGCIFCAPSGTAFEAMESTITITQQLASTKVHIQKKYKAKKFIAYFQNYTNTFLPITQFREYMIEAAQDEDIVEIAVSTRPDCIEEAYLDVLQEIKHNYEIEITIELGLQTANYRTLQEIRRGHTLAEFIDAVLIIQPYTFNICVHVILNLPGDDLTDSIETAKIISALRIPIVKIHSLYIAKNTSLCERFENGTISMCTKEEYINRLISFLEYLNPQIVVERLFSRIPEKDAVFCNWGTSWWKLKDEVLAAMEEKETYQGRRYHYLHGAALNTIKDHV